MKKFLIILLCVVVGIAMWKVPFGATVLEYETITYDANPTVDLNGLEKNIKKTLAAEDCRTVIKKGCVVKQAQHLRYLMFDASPMSVTKEWQLRLLIEKDKKIKQVLKEVECGPGVIDKYYKLKFPHNRPARSNSEVPKPACLAERHKRVKKLPILQHSKTSWVISKEYEMDIELLWAQDDLDQKISDILESKRCDKNGLKSDTYQSSCISESAEKIRSLKTEINRLLKARKAEHPTYEELVTEAEKILSDMNCDWKWSKWSKWSNNWWMAKPVPDCSAKQAKTIRELIFIPIHISEEEAKEIREIIRSVTPPNVGDPEVCKSGLLNWSNKKKIYDIPECMIEQLKKVKAIDYKHDEADREERDKKLLQLLLIEHLEKSIAFKIARIKNCSGYNKIYKHTNYFPSGSKTSQYKECVSRLVGEFYNWNPQRSGQ